MLSRRVISHPTIPARNALLRMRTKQSIQGPRAEALCGSGLLCGMRGTFLSALAPPDLLRCLKVDPIGLEVKMKHGATVRKAV